MFIQTKTGGNQHQRQAGKYGSRGEELVRHMSSLPGFLQRGEKPQDKILNFGVLDWERLENWKHKQKPISVQSRPVTSYVGSCSSASTKGSSVAPGTVKTGKSRASHSEICSSEKVKPSPGFLLPYSSLVTDNATIEKCGSNEQRRRTRKEKSCYGATSEKSSHKMKGQRSKQKESLEMGMPSSKLDAHTISTSKETISVDMPKKKMEKCNGPDSEPAHKNDHRKQDSIILLLPKDFSESGCLDESQETFFSGNSAELNWSSFSDVFSIEELHFEESVSDVPHSCPLPSMENAETELDINLERLIDDQRMQPPSQVTLSAHLDHKLFPSHEVHHGENMKREMTSSTTSEASNGLSHKTLNMKATNATADPSLTRPFSFGIGRLSRSLSFKEGSTLPRLKHVPVRSGPAQALNFKHSSFDKAGNATPRGRISPFRRLLDPILKHKASKPISDVDSSLSYTENNLSTKEIRDVQAIHAEQSLSKVNNALLQLTVKSGLPLFKFLVETNNEILASTVKQLSTFERDDPSWLYSFYSVQEVKKKSGSWLYQGSKGKPPDFSYTVIGQMNVSKPFPCGDEDKLEEITRRESVLYGVDLSKLDKAASESTVNRELGAIVIKVPKEESGDDQKKYDKAEIIIPGSIVVILPGAVHSLPSEGVPASLIDRWRSGGLCDCGGWDVGCKLQILANQDENEKPPKPAFPFQKHCNLFLQDREKQNKPIFRLLDRGEGIYSVEYESSMSSLQAFAISVAVLSDQKHTNLSVANSYSEERKCHYRSKSSIIQGEGTRYATYPPHSPVGRA
ncbi:hypothetical protein V2J09_009427 [Rumex salicifolius]